MNKLLTMVLGLFLLSSCDKEVCEEPYLSHPNMQYTDLQNAEVKYGTSQRLDVDHDGKTDFSFGTLLVGDALGQRDRLQFYADSKIETALPVNESEQVPVLSAGEVVKIQYAAYTWYDLSAIVLAEKITPAVGTPYWEGLWKTAAHRYLPILVKRAGQHYYGWVELSFDTATEKMILHRAAISTEAGREVKAGY